jgi:chromosome segregation ATPase
MSIFYKHVLISDMEIKNKAWQVAELEESKNNLLLENQQLRENVSGLHSTIQNLENSSSSASQDASAKVCLCYLLCLKSTVNIHS